MEKYTSLPNSEKRTRNRLRASVKTQALLRRTIFGLVIFVLVIAAYFLASQFPTYQAILTGAAWSLLTSLLFLIVYVAIIEAPLKDIDDETFAADLGALNDSIKLGIDEALERRLRVLLGDKALKFEGQLDELLPKNFFPPSNESNPEFMRDLGRGVHDTRQYRFRGSSAKFAAGLLAKWAMPNRLINCWILIVDPRFESAIRVHAQDRINARIAGDRPVVTLDAAENDLRAEIRSGIISLFELRDRLNIDIRTCADHLFYRSEIVDSGAFVSFYTEDRSTSYPPTYLYDHNTFYYKAFLRDFQQSWDNPKAHFSISASTTRQQLNDFLAQLGLEVDMSHG